MFGNVKVERKALESTYEDTCTVSRMVPVEGSNGITKPEPATVYKDVICALSASGDSSKQTEAQHLIEYDVLLFVQPETIIESGDQITVKRFGRMDPNSTYVKTFEVVGVPVPYVTHIQAKLKAVDLA